ncbi:MULTISPECIES: DotI/IcmL family type IV secretion protein [Cysteiniphilum]|uniref:DotI/IcmL family type IV secretion protein n=1 Tax=Cysteiniphilum TaxID=2056696 RepID=UPI00177E6DE5|nr:MULTISPECIES: DotI/IcmL family type IV secretion protein [Cysteiniphilum]
MKNNTLKIIAERADFYKKNFRLMINTLLVSGLMNFLLVGYIIYDFTTHTTYFLAVDDKASVKSLKMTSTPEVTRDMVINWVSLNVTKLFQLDFLNYKNQLFELKGLFTSSAWHEFNRVTLKEIELLSANKYVSRASLIATPVINAKGHINGVKSWKVTVPMMITYSADSGLLSKKIILTLTIQQNLDANSINSTALSIVQIVQKDDK